MWEGNTGGAGGGGHWHNTTASTSTQGRYSTTRGASVTTTRGCRQRLGEAADGLNRCHCSESGGFPASSSTGANTVRESRAH